MSIDAQQPMPAAIPVRRPLLRGSQLVRALWLDVALLGEDGARSRVIAHWESAARVYRLADAYVLVWPRARRLLCERADGVPLSEQEGVLASAPLGQQDLAGLAEGSVVLVRGAAVHAFTPEPAQCVDPSQWIDLSAIPVCVPWSMPDVEPLVPPAAPPVPDVRAILGNGVPPPSREQAEFLRRVAAFAARGGEPAALRSPRTGQVAAGAVMGVAGLIGGLAMALAQVFARTPGGSGGQSRQAAAQAPRAAGRFAAHMERLAQLSRLSALLGWRQARYLRNMVRQFERGELDEALRHAIPLDRVAQAGKQAWSMPRRRGTLDVTGPASSAAAIGLDSGSMDFLRQTYRNSFKALDRAGRIDEAAFVLAELLNCGREAVDYLEQKGRFAQAAQMAETLVLDPAVAVRLHALSGDLGRAVKLARLTQSFAVAVAELERRRHADAAALRGEWAESLAASGSPVEAALAIWPLADRRDRALAWLESAGQAGGVLGVRGLLYRMALAPATSPEGDPRLRQLLDEEGEEAARQRARAADCLLGMDERNAVIARIAAQLWRRVLCDRSAGHHGVPAAQLHKLLQLADDLLLRVDVPKMAPSDTRAPPALRARGQPLVLHFAETGLLPLADVRRLPDGGYLLALGEQGVALVHADGRQRCRFPVPAQHLVLASTGQRALALAWHDRTARVSRIDLLDRKVAPWFRGEFEHWADDYDGIAWDIGAGNRLMALDCAAAQQSVLWQVGDLPGQLIGITRNSAELAFVLAQGEKVEQWRYQLPQRRLVQREDVFVNLGAEFVFPDPGSATPVMLTRCVTEGKPEPTALSWPRSRHGAGATVGLEWAKPLETIRVRDGLIVLAGADDSGWRAVLVDFNGRTLAEIHLPDAHGPGVTLQSGHLLAWDRRGRLIDVDIETGASRSLTP